MLQQFLLLLFALLIAHAYFDGPGQGDFLSRAKNHKNPFPGIPAWWGLTMHSLIHAGAVWIITGFAWMAVVELIAHALIDFFKCNEQISFMGDQVLHFLCKVFYANTAILVWYVHSTQPSYFFRTFLSG